MKMPIAWHEGNLKNQEAFHSRQVRNANEMIAACQKLEKEINQLCAQIMAAKDLGIDGFDADKFGKKRKP